MGRLVGNVGRLFFGIVMIGAFSLAFGDAGAFTDPRDGQTYRTVRIGDLTWMAQNLNFTTDDSWCYGDDASNCERYGRLYTWDAAMTACPAGWRLPTGDDLNNLLKAAGGIGWRFDGDQENIDYLFAAAVASGDIAATRLKSRSPDWDGTDDLGFSALPGGSHSGDNFNDIGERGVWWNASELNRFDAWYWDMSSSNLVSSDYGDKSCGFSVRCVRE
ncbi:MAG: fibrobacter succinogenes major paralogous domain-containing protein [Chitinispirillales bacterium]|nr:fibrobacter succinogenes major paralogous domain-containing protein [Chitinispirillales bacterium]